MRMKKKVAKKRAKNKTKKDNRHVDRAPCQEVPNVIEPDTDLQLIEAETSDQHEDEVPPPIQLEEEVKVEAEASTEKEESSDQDQKVPELPPAPVEEKPKYASLCHQRIEKLKQSESGARGSLRRKLSLQVVSDPSKQNPRRMSLADVRQVKHPLQDTWTFWYYMGNKCKQWNENLRQICKIGTVEDFWCLQNDLICPSQLSPGKDFSFFKKPIRPEWEDAANKIGGMWSFCPRDKDQKTSDMDQAWLEILMFLIGDQFDKLSVYVNGASYSKRKSQDRISLWIGAELHKTEEILKIGQLMKTAISYAIKSFKVEYSTSDDWKQKIGSAVTIRHSL